MMKLVNNLVSPKLPEPGNAFLDSPFVHSHLLMPQSVSIDIKVFVKYFCKAKKLFKLSTVELWDILLNVGDLMNVYINQVQLHIVKKSISGKNYVSFTQPFQISY